MNEQELQQAFIQFLAQKTGAKSQQELEAVIQQLGEEGLKQAYAEFMQLMQQQQVQAAKFGAKLNYIKQLRGQCPDGYEMKYFKSGGSMTKKCVACEKQVEVETPSDPIEAFRCGRKMKKKECGGSVEMDKCGSKMKKKACGGSVEKDKCGSKMPMQACGGKTVKKKTSKAQQGVKLIAKTGKGEDFMAGSPEPFLDKPAQSLLNPDGSQYMTRVIPQPGDTAFVAPRFVTMKDPGYVGLRDKFNKLWNSRKSTKTKPVTAPAEPISDEEVPL